ncbi:MAG: hypothetical protein ACXABY_12920 [Candidatus Thorarchaeota archaeon]|jgi:hypothetical protein
MMSKYKSKSEFASEEEYRAYRRSPEFGEYMNSEAVINEQRKLGAKLHSYKERRRKLHEQHRNSQQII